MEGFNSRVKVNVGVQPLPGAVVAALEKCQNVGLGSVLDNLQLANSSLTHSKFQYFTFNFFAAVGEFLRPPGRLPN